jgi:hypothetical protein
MPPKGAKEFASLLQETNVPIEAVAPESFNKAGVLTYNLGTLFSPATSTKTKPKKQKSSDKKRSSTLSRRKIAKPIRYSSIKWAKL